MKVVVFREAMSAEVTFKDEEVLSALKAAGLVATNQQAQVIADSLAGNCTIFSKQEDAKPVAAAEVVVAQGTLPGIEAAPPLDPVEAKLRKQPPSFRGVFLKEDGKFAFQLARNRIAILLFLNGKKGTTTNHIEDGTGFDACTIRKRHYLPTLVKMGLVKRNPGGSKSGEDVRAGQDTYPLTNKGEKLAEQLRADGFTLAQLSRKN
jgi:hypothetical protein